MNVIGGLASDIAVTGLVSRTLDLTAPRHGALEAIGSLSPEDLDSYLSTLAELLHAGVVGTETIEVDGRAYTRFAELAIGDESHRGAPPYRHKLDLRI